MHAIDTALGVETQVTQMKRILLIAATFSLASAAPSHAQTPTPETRALNARLGVEINANIQCMTSAFAMQDQLTAAQSEVKRLTEKYEPKAEENKK